MRFLMIAAAASLLVTAATAQTTVTTGVGTAAVQIEPEYRAKIKTYVTEKKIWPVATQDESLSAPRSLPALSSKQCRRIGDPRSASIVMFIPMTA